MHDSLLFQCHFPPPTVLEKFPLEVYSTSFDRKEYYVKNTDVRINPL